MFVTHTQSTHLCRFVPHVGNVLLLAVVLRPGTCQVSASVRTLRGPQLDAMLGAEQENEEQERSGREGEEEDGGVTEENQRGADVRPRCSLGRKQSVNGSAINNAMKCDTSAAPGRAAGSTHGRSVPHVSACACVCGSCVGFHFDVNPSCNEPSGCSLPPNLTQYL